MPASTTVTLPGGRVISRATADAAADWLTVLMSGDAGTEEQQQWNAWRQANAICPTCVTASGSSALTWKIGACRPLAMSVA